MPRSIWKGAVSFGLVHIPVSVVSATRQSGIDFDWLDERSLDPVGYKRINKTTGKEVPSEHIVKGIEHGKGKYVVLSEDEIHNALPEATRTIDILTFVEAREISILHFEKPYYLAPDKNGEKVYALLRDTLSAAGKVGVANLVMHSKQHLAVIMPLGDALVLNTLRWADEVRSAEDVGLEGLDAKVSKKEVDMAQRLVDDMTEQWDPEQYHDTFKDNVMALVERKLKDGKLEAVAEEPEAEDSGADVIDLTELLRRSLGGKKDKAKEAPKSKSSGRSTTRRSPAASRTRKAK
ncbi:Ku protein [Pseudomonas sp. HR1]|jgi:DNA end-binding protein Ku|uniref:non-homologous end joining protein Ku n=1 Tax=Pseudomonadaceae TaxID=135621 RepID=UPI0003FC1383|nr:MULTISPECIES: Ku protein [Pseudomonas]HCV79004.1 Ku protein [Pseudomonas sp.]MBA1260074.1 Ku protein [Pseudomonas psychrotolerans]MBH3330338.1 Ku protein [Pseudomonas oryzihabitans]MCI1011227.1 Ku protein [Pseudomonas oryzihabitans]MDK4201409.1 Ku protein [Pseudomonas sp. HR1]